MCYLWKDAKEKALRNNNLDLTWELNITQFCQVHYMSHIMNEYKKNDGDIEDVDMIIDDIEDVDVISEHTFKDKLNDGGKIYEIDFINSVKSMVKIFLKREKKEDKPPIYDWTLLHESLESEDDKLIPFLNMLEKLINPSDRNLAEQTITQWQKGLSFLCYFLAGIGNKQISAIRKDIAMFLDQSGTTNQAIDTFSSIQLSSSSRENRPRVVPNDAIHNPLLIDCDSLIFQIENCYMSLLSQSYNNRFANQLILSEDDLFDSLVSYCYDAEIHEKKEERQLKNTLLIDFIHLKLKSTRSYIEAMK
ncbi:7743_t:CDS:2, partial [Entrophospora sp. SA101]